MAPRTKTEHFLRLKGSSNPPTTLRALATQHQEPYGNVEARFKRASKASRNILDTTRGGTGLIPFKLGGCEYEASAVSLKFSKAEFILSFPWGDVLVIVDGTGQLFVCGEHFAIAMGYRGKSIMETRQVVRSKIHPAVPVKWKDLVTNELTLPEEQKAQLLQKYDSDGLWITQEAFVDWIATARKPDAVSFRRWFFQKCLDLILSSRLNARWEDMPLEQRTAVQARKDACELNKLLDDIMQPLGGSCTMVHTKVLDKLLGCTRTSFMEQVGINPKSHFSTPAVIKGLPQSTYNLMKETLMENAANARLGDMTDKERQAWIEDRLSKFLPLIDYQGFHDIPGIVNRGFVLTAPEVSSREKMFRDLSKQGLLYPSEKVGEVRRKAQQALLQ